MIKELNIYGRNFLITEEIIKIIKLVKIVYKWSIVGGNCHVVVDDCNLDDQNIDFCLRLIEEDLESSKNKLKAERCLMKLLKQLSLDTRSYIFELLEVISNKDLEQFSQIELDCVSCKDCRNYCCESMSNCSLTDMLIFCSKIDCNDDVAILCKDYTE